MQAVAQVRDSWVPDALSSSGTAPGNRATTVREAP